MAIPFLIITALMMVVAPAAAQSTYVGGSIVGEIARFSEIETDDEFRDGEGESLSGETFGLGFTVGRRLGERWGVEFEFVRSAAIERESTRRISPLGPTLPVPIPIPIPFPEIDLEIDSEQRHTTMAALAWVRQELGDGIELAYLGGVSFYRIDVERDLRLSGRPILRGVPIPQETELVEHGAGPTVGLDASFRLTERAAVVTGVRMHGVRVSGQGGWLIRPTAGFRWRF